MKMRGNDGVYIVGRIGAWEKLKCGCKNWSIGEELQRGSVMWSECHDEQTSCCKIERWLQSMIHETLTLGETLKYKRSKMNIEK
jgi:hypothetical protein